MAKDSIRDFSATAGSNTDIQSVNIDENCPASGINNAIRELMVDLKNVSTGAVNLETPAADQLNVDNIRIDGNTISSTDTNGDITLDPNGTGNTIIASGNVGIGRTPTAYGSFKVLDVAGSSGAIQKIIHTGSSVELQAYASSSLTAIGSATNHPLTFTTNDTERMRIDNSGSVRVGDSSSLGNGIFQIDATANFVYCQVMRANASNGAFVLFQKDDGSTIGVIDHTASATRYLTSSDHRLKENVADMTGAIDRVKALAPKRFNFIADPDDTTVDGFLAHEAQTVVPEAISGSHNEVDEDGNAVMQGIDQSKLVPLLTGALQEAIAKIETLETEMTALKARVTALEA